MSALNAPYFHDDNKAREHLEAIRWPKGAICTHCGSPKVYTLNGKAHRPGLYKCSDCRNQFSVTVGTVFESSKIGLSKWLQAVYLICSSKKGISSHQIHRTLGVTYKTAWFMTHRIREAMKDTTTNLLGGPNGSGIVEADEAYFGNTKGLGKGPHLKAETLRPILKSQIAASARLMTDSARVYDQIGPDFRMHETVDHSKEEYRIGFSRGRARSRTAKSTGESRS